MLEMTVAPYLTEVSTVLLFSQSESLRRVRAGQGGEERVVTGEVSDEGEVRDLDTGPAKLEDDNEGRVVEHLGGGGQSPGAGQEHEGK